VKRGAAWVAFARPRRLNPYRNGTLDKKRREITELAMQAITLKDAKRNLARLIEQVLADAEPRIVVTDQGEQVVLMPLDEFNSWKETLYLLASPQNAARLRRSIAEAKAGQAEKKELRAE
jgi:antitoxin YefM